MKTHEERLIHNNLKILLNELPSGQHYRFNGSGRLVDKRQSSNRAPDHNGQSDISRSSNTDDDVAASTEPARSDWQTPRARRHQSTTYEESAEQTPGGSAGNRNGAGRGGSAKWREWTTPLPLMKQKKKYAKQAPWVTNGLRASIINKNKLYRKSLKHPTAFNQSEYSKYRNKLTKLLRSQERNYYENLINQNKHNLSKTWSVISTVINNKKSKTKCSKFIHNDRYITNDNEISRYWWHLCKIYKIHQWRYCYIIVLHMSVIINTRLFS